MPSPRRWPRASTRRGRSAEATPSAASCARRAGTTCPPTRLPRQPGDVMVEPWVREALIRLNPEIAAQPDRADEVIYNLRASSSPCRPTAWCGPTRTSWPGCAGEKTMPFGPNGEHVPVRLVDADRPGNNRLTVTNQWTYQAGPVEKRFDVVFVVNGLPLVIGEAKTPTRSAVTWFDGAFQINEIYEKASPGHVRAERLLLCHRGQAVPLRLHPHAHRHVGAVARRGEPGRRPAAPRQGHGRRACCGPRWCWTSCRTSPSSPPTRSTAASRSSAATSSTRPPTRSSPAWSRAIRRRASSGISRAAASRC